MSNERATSNYCFIDCAGKLQTVVGKTDFTTVNRTETGGIIKNMFKQIKDYKVSNRTTIVFFSDGTKETITCSKGDEFDIEEGIILCVIKRIFGDNYRKDVKSVIKAKTIREENVRKLEQANKESKIREERREQKKRENKLRRKAKYEAKLELAIEEEKKKLQNKK